MSKKLLLLLCNFRLHQFPTIIALFSLICVSENVSRGILQQASSSTRSQVQE